MNTIASKEACYHLLTESSGLKASREQLERLYQRYRFALPFAMGKDVLEVACGTGLGLGYLATGARRVFAGDIDEENIAQAHEHYSGSQNIKICLLDAHQLPFPGETFDLVLLYEAIYYLAAPQKFIAESARVLRKGGVLIICTVNKDWEDFHPSPFTHRYYSVPELARLLDGSFSDTAFYGGFSTACDTKKDRLVSLIKRAAVKLNLMPRTLKGRAHLKRLFIGKLVPLPERVYDGMASYQAPAGIDPTVPDKAHKIIYAVAKKKEDN